ncbi:hypothetical protein CEUSTIGMA_g10438.t1 [Chlamydomonas eustigma]|uniref:Phosphodiesterase n=1 Tax=Chlamydomonas eustigma TaxID=1157962 RepID=A0A250XIU9_9CHLO|nr:hypothetical protein CEUSTIGMA_g10438.t1 [Chlamydomonas eustigma]|eukprot:GAX83011.1 hypothetical protein CEUSTIGMA_g10438.t1 [Chlamydomonas eustigma]
MKDVYKATGSSTHMKLWLTLRVRVQVVWDTIKCYPSTLIIPLLLLCALTGGGVAIVITLSNSTANDNRDSAQQDANAVGILITEVLRDVVQPTFSIALYIQANAIYYANILRNFPVLAQQLLAQVPNSADGNIWMALGPMATEVEVYPVNNMTSQVVGLNVLNTSVLLGNLDLPTGQPYSLIGPVKGLLSVNQLVMIILVPVFVPNITANYSFNFPANISELCPPEFSKLCFKEYGQTGLGSKFWGHVAGVIDLKSFILGDNGALSSLLRKGYSYQLLQSSPYLEPTPGVTSLSGQPATVIASRGNLEGDPVSVVVNLTTATGFQPLTLLITNASGWNPSWTAGVLAAVVILAVIISVLAFALLLYMRQHQRLLHALLPRTAVSSIFQSDIIDSIMKDPGGTGKLLQAGTPVERLMELLNLLMRGSTPDLSEVLSLRSAFMNGGALIFQPQDLRSQLKRAHDLDDDVIDALLREVQGLSPEQTKSLDTISGRDNSNNGRKGSHEAVDGFIGALSDGELRRGSVTWAIGLFMSELSGMMPHPLSITLLEDVKLGIPVLPDPGNSNNEDGIAPSFRLSLEGTSAKAIKGSAATTTRSLSAAGQQPVADLELSNRVDMMSRVKPLLADPAVKLLEAAYGSWSFDAFELSELTGGHPLSSLLFFLVARCGLIRTLNLDPEILARLCLAIEEGYNPNPYHNKTHAADVLQAMHTILISTGMAVFDPAPAIAGDNGSSPKCYCGPQVMLACLLAAASHDLGHKGVTNDFLINIDDELALVYSDKSPMEHFHLALLFKLLKLPHLNLLSHLSKSEITKFRKMVIDLISATDMKSHFAIFTQFSTTHQVSDSSPSGNAQETTSSRALSQAFSRSSWPNVLAVAPKDDAEQIISLQVVLKCSDLINIARPLEVTKKWCRALEQEFFEQGDREREMGLPLSPLFDRNKPGVTKSQVGFYDFMVFPLFHNFACVFPGARPMVDMARSNYKFWKMRTDSKRQSQKDEE